MRLRTVHETFPYSRSSLHRPTALAQHSNFPASAGTVFPPPSCTVKCHDRPAVRLCAFRGRSTYKSKGKCGSCGSAFTLHIRDLFDIAKNIVCGFLTLIAHTANCVLRPDLQNATQNRYRHRQSGPVCHASSCRPHDHGRRLRLDLSLLLRNLLYEL